MVGDMGIVLPVLGVKDPVRFVPRSDDEEQAVAVASVPGAMGDPGAGLEGDGVPGAERDLTGRLARLHEPQHALTLQYVDELLLL